MTSPSLEILPDGIISRVTSYLPQHSKVQLAYTNYRIYTLVLPLLYKRLLINKGVILPSNQDFQDALFTNIGTLKNPLVNEKKQNEVFYLRQEVLLQSLTINAELCNYVEELVILDHHHNSSTLDFPKTHLTPNLCLDLFAFVKRNCKNLKSFQTGDSGISLSTEELVKLDKLEEVTLSELSQIDILPPSVKKLSLSTAKKNSSPHQFNDQSLHKLLQLNTLILSTDESFTINFLESLLSSLPPDKKMQLKSLRVIYYHGFNDYNHICRELVGKLLEKVNIEKLANFEIVTGCEQMACTCLMDFSKFLSSSLNFNLKKLSIIQKTVHRDHNYTEKFDVAFTDLLSNLPNNHQLEYLSIRHSPPLDGRISNGFEGNYVKRRDLYANVIPKLSNLRTLIAPTIMQSFASYEQLVSDLLWNGCECTHCTDYLPLYDEYIMKHEYYDETSGTDKDVISSVLFGCAADTLSKRLATEDGLSVLDMPFFEKYWNFHGYFGFQHKGNYNCQFNESCYKPLATCISHFLKDYAISLGKSNPRLNYICFSGVFFLKLGTEWKCVYD